MEVADRRHECDEINLFFYDNHKHYQLVVNLTVIDASDGARLTLISQTGSGNEDRHKWTIVNSTVRLQLDCNIREYALLRQQWTSVQIVDSQISYTCGEAHSLYGIV